MRDLQKHPEPQYLTSRKVALALAYQTSIAAGTAKSVWSAEPIRSALTSETEGRCAYCDAEIAHVATAHIEHYRPRETYPNRVVDWNNLTIACPACNGKKHAKFDETLPFVNPFHDDPDSHFVYSGDLIFAPSSTRGDHSIREIGLNRDAAVRARRRRIEYVNAQVTYWASAATPMKAGIAREIIEDWRTGEYYAAVRGYLRLISFPGA